MTVEEIAKIGVWLIASLGGGAAIVASLSGWLGKIWAERLLESEKNLHQSQLEEFKARLERDSDHAAQTFREKLSLYKEATQPILELVTESLSTRAVTPVQLIEFDKKRLQPTALLGMFAPIQVFHA